MIVARLTALCFLAYFMRSIPYEPGMPPKEILIIGLIAGVGLLTLKFLLQDIIGLFRSRSDDP